MNHQTNEATAHKLYHSTTSYRRAMAALMLFGLCVMSPTLQAQDAEAVAESSEHQALVDIYYLDSSGGQTPQSLKAIDWQSSEDSALLAARPEDDNGWFPLLAMSRNGAPIDGRNSLAVGQERPSGMRIVALGANPVHDLVSPHITGARANARTEAWFENVIGWLLERDNPFSPSDAPSLNVALMNLAGLNGESGDTYVRDWFESRGNHITVTTPDTCVQSRVKHCSQDSLTKANLLILGPGHEPSEAEISTPTGKRPALGNIGRILQLAELRGIPVLYMHEGAVDSPLATRILKTLGLDAKYDIPNAGVSQASGSQLLGTPPSLAAAKP